MRIIAVCVAALALMLAGCGGAEASDRSKALCADLDDGLTLMNIYGGVREDFTPKEFAGQVYVAVDQACPQYRDNPGVRTMLENWGYMSPGEPWPDD